MSAIAWSYVRIPSFAKRILLCRRSRALRPAMKQSSELLLVEDRATPGATHGRPELVLIQLIGFT
jgi:hypothetical protein